ncbi:MAG: hypothetical protein WKF83_09870 [Nocardioidaceae bacterium]
MRTGPGCCCLSAPALLHIGPQKTGTTAVQGAFHTNRAALAEHGVHYAGKTRQPRPAAAAVVLGTALPGFPADSVDRWPALVEEVRTSSADRVVISAEMFANAGEAAARTVVEAFDANRTRVVITLRPLAKIMPSQWQQFIQSGAHMSYAEFLDAMLDQPRDTSEHTQAFWHRHRHDELIERWAGVVGPDNVTVIAIDDRERRMLLDTFELLLGLPAGAAGVRHQEQLIAVADRDGGLPRVQPSVLPRQTVARRGACRGRPLRHGDLPEERADAGV